jgi:hypothetical protein
MGHIVDLQTALITDGSMAQHTRKAIEDILEELRRSNHFTQDRVQHMKPFTEAFVQDKGDFPDSE